MPELTDAPGATSTFWFDCIRQFGAVTCAEFWRLTTSVAVRRLGRERADVELPRAQSGSYPSLCAVEVTLSCQPLAGNRLFSNAGRWPDIVTETVRCCKSV